MVAWVGWAVADGAQNLSPWQQMRVNAMYMQQLQAQQQARKQAGGFLYNQYGGAQQPQMPAAIPQVPQQAAPPPGSMSPGGGNPQVMQQQQPPQQPPPRGPFGPSMQQGMPQGGGGMPPPPMAQAGGQPQGGMQMTGQGGIPNLAQQAGGMQQRPGGPAMAPPPPLQPFKALPTSPASNDTQGGVPPPPQAAAAPGEQHQRPFNLKGIVQGLKASGVKPEKVMDMLDALSPAMTAENKQELDMFKAQNKALEAANLAFSRVMAAQAAMLRAGTGVKAEERRTDQGQQNIDIKKQKEARLKRAAEQAGGGALTKTEFLYPNGADGKPDTTKPPIGVRGVTKTGKIINLDAEGKQVSAQPGNPAPKAGAQKDNVRTSIVKSGITNAIARLNEIDKLGYVSTSSFFGQHGDNPLTRGAYGAAKGMQSKGQQDTDAKWASMIDEAIPVFTGGLRGSDAFRRFLIEQAPGPGDKPETIREKKRLFRQNIEGTSKAFFNKFSTDPSFWGPGVTKEQLGEGGGGAAPQQDGAPAGMPAGATVIGKSPDGKDVYQTPDGKRYTAD